jgi:transglutaminase-like putative cysteine protease
MQIRISHTTSYTYEKPLRQIIQMLRLTPQDHEGQHVMSWRIEPSVDGRIRKLEDGFGNIVHDFSAEGPLEHVSIHVEGWIETLDTQGIIRGIPDKVPHDVYLRSTDLTRADAAILAFATQTTRSAGTSIEKLHRLLNRIHDEFVFDTEPTHVATTAAESFAMRSGVCQDLTHIFVTCARHLDIPARYVSGYFVRVDGVTEVDAGHAWAEAWVPELGWLGFDTANGICPVDAHVRVAIGLDYADAAPLRGSRFGGGSEKLQVEMSVAQRAQ